MREKEAREELSGEGRNERSSKGRKGKKKSIRLKEKGKPDRK